MEAIEKKERKGLDKGGRETPKPGNLRKLATIFGTLQKTNRKGN